MSDKNLVLDCGCGGWIEVIIPIKVDIVECRCKRKFYHIEETWFTRKWCKRTETYSDVLIKYGKAKESKERQERRRNVYK